MHIHLKKRVAITVKLLAAALIGTFVSFVAQGKVPLEHLPKVMDGLIYTVTILLAGATWRAIGEANNVVPLYKTRSKREAWSIEEVVEYVLSKGQRTYKLCVLVFLGTSVTKIIPELIPFSDEVYLMIQGGLLGVLTLLFFQFFDHYTDLNAYKLRIAFDQEERERRSRAAEKID